MRQVKVGNTSNSIYLNIVSSTDGTPITTVTSATAGLALQYVRNQAAAVNISGSITDLASASSPFSAGGIIHVAGGVYRVDVADAAFVAGVDTVEIIGTATSMIVLRETVQLVGYNPRTELTTAVLNRIDENISAAKTLTSAAYQAIWDVLASAQATTGSLGKKIKDWVLGSDNKSMISADAQTGVVIPRVTVTDAATVVNGLASGVITNASIADGALTAAKFGNDFPDVVDEIFAYLMSNSVPGDGTFGGMIWDIYNRTGSIPTPTTILEALVAPHASVGDSVAQHLSNLDERVSSLRTALASVFNATTGDTAAHIEVRQGDDLSQSFNVTPFGWIVGNRLLLTILRPELFGQPNTVDADSTLQYLLTNGGSIDDGLVFVHGNPAGADQSNGGIVAVDPSTGALRMDLKHAVNYTVKANQYYYEVVLITSGNVRTTLTAKGSIMEWVQTMTSTL